MAVTRTIGPLHMEDLEPHRFEDMVRQLIYDFRSWSSLEGTGRSGDELGFDVRGVERIFDSSALEEIEPLDVDSEPFEKTTERIWLIQCKREKKITPGKLSELLIEIKNSHAGKISGLIIAAACDLSFRSREVFRALSAEIGVDEAYLWGKAEIEDMLFQPKNDHLLFAYFGISLQLRAKTTRLQTRSRLVIKRKAERILTRGRNVLLRDASDNRYPFPDQDKDHVQRKRWEIFQFIAVDWDGIRILHRKHFAYIADDKVGWDYAECSDTAEVWDNPWGRKTEEIYSERNEDYEKWHALPKSNQAWYEAIAVIPFENIIDIDERGDSFFRGPHLYLLPFPDDGPFLGYYTELRSIDGVEFETDMQNRLGIFDRRE